MQNEAWGRNLRNLIAQRRMSQRQFAREHGFTERTLNSWCNGRWPGEEEARKVANALNLDYSDLVGDNQPIRLDEGLFSTAVIQLDRMLESLQITLNSERRATLYRLAYERFAQYQNYRDLQRYLNDLINIAPNTPSVPSAPPS